VSKLRIGVLFGGQSGEHEVSLVSASAVMANLDPQRYEVIGIGITKQGRWLAGGDPLSTLMTQADRQLLPAGATPDPAAPPAAEVPSPQAIIPVAASAAPNQQLPALDLVFPVLHGPMGEDGTVQGLFELAGVPYVGCGVLASAVGMDKAMMKSAFSAMGLPLLPWLLVRRSIFQADPQATLDRIEAELHYPIFVKPANMGSSVGISKARDRAGLLAGLHEAARYDRRIVVEQGIAAREIEISVLGNEQIAASVPGEVVPSNEWYDYEAKYLAGQSQILIPAPIDPAKAEEVRSLAIQAFAAVDGSGLARVDFLMDKETCALYLNEVNTMPGFTPVSMYAQMWAASGLSYPQLLDRLIELALERHRDRRQG
jgi:D-alanine-D-alanine ligase